MFGNRFAYGFQGNSEERGTPPWLHGQGHGPRFFAMGQSDTTSRVTVELVPETEATKVTVTHDQWADTDSAYGATADGWPRILSRLKTLIETGKTFKPH